MEDVLKWAARVHNMTRKHQARRIQATYRRARNDPYGGFGVRTALRRAGFDHENANTVRLARAGVSRAPR